LTKKKNCGKKYSKAQLKQSKKLQDVLVKPVETATVIRAGQHRRS